MASKKPTQEKSRLHIRNRNRERYDIEALLVVVPELEKHVAPNKLGQKSIDFSNPVAVKLLNKALLFHYYGISYWEFPDENLCPPIPGRADYLHYIADLLSEHNFGRLPEGNKITCMDIGVGANCIYPLIGVIEYDWNFIASDIDSKSIASTKQIIVKNPLLENKITCKLQKEPKDIFYNILNRDYKIDMSICNPPFHESKEDAEKGTLRKIKNLSGKELKTPKLNFAGISNELVYEGGEARFIQNMIRESKKFSKNCYWFTTLVSKQSNLKAVYKSLKKYAPTQIKTIPMGTGNKTSRIVAWTFLSPQEQKEWRAIRWNAKQ